MDRFATAIIVSWGTRRGLIALLAGAASALAQPPFFLFFVLWFTLPVLVWLIDGAVETAKGGAIRRLVPAFVTGWCFGFGYFLANLWWVGSAFLVDAGKFGWLLPIAVVGLPALLALFWGAGVAFAQLLWRDGWQRIFALAAGLGLAEWLRSFVLTGFPWVPIGHALTAGEILMQSAALMGTPALNVLAVIIFAAPASLAPKPENGRRFTALPVLSLLVMIGLAGYGVVRLSQADTGANPAGQVRIVQPAIAQRDKWVPDNKDAIFKTLLDLSAPPDLPPLDGRTLIVWPEMAFPFLITSEPDALAAIADLLPEGATLVSGAARADTFTGSSGDPLSSDSTDPDAAADLNDAGSERPTLFNSIYVIGDDGTIENAYDKVHLVPFGEYLPLQNMLESLGLRQITNIKGGFTPGHGRRKIDLDSGTSFAPLICYEIIFHGDTLRDGERPDFLINVTNDAWFGRTSGPHQHFHLARIRALETGLGVVRAANTGISAVIDPYGRVLVRSGMGVAQTLNSAIPAALEIPSHTIRNRILFVFLVLVSIFVAFSRKIT